jgi:hypothetical protein
VFLKKSVLQACFGKLCSYGATASPPESQQCNPLMSNKITHSYESTKIIGDELSISLYEIGYKLDLNQPLKKAKTFSMIKLC